MTIKNFFELKHILCWVAAFLIPGLVLFVADKDGKKPAGSFAGYAQLPDGTTTDWVPGGVGDFDQDDNPDMIWHNEVDGRNGIWFLDGVTLTGVEFITTVTDTVWKIEN